MQSLLRYILSFLVFYLTAQPLYAIGFKTMETFPSTPLSNAKSWSIDVAGGDWVFFASQDGLLQYDGSACLAFSTKNRSSLRSVTTDTATNRVFVGAINEFGYFIPSAGSSLEYICLSDSIVSDRSIGNIWGVYPDESRILVQGDMNIIIYDEHSASHSLVNSRDKLDCSAMIDGVLWLGTDAGLKLLMGKNIIDAPGAEALRDKRIRTIMDNGNDILIVTASDGVYRYSSGYLWRDHKASAAATRLGEVFCATIRGNTLALGSIDNGIGLVDLSSGSMTVYNESIGLPNNTVLTIAFDGNGNLWAGLDPGTVRISLTLPIETFSNNSLPIGSGYMLASRGDRLYLGTNRGAWYVDHQPGTDFTGIDFKRLDGVTGQIWGLAEVGDELFCCADRGLFVIRGEKAIKIEGVREAWDVKPLSKLNDKAYVSTYLGIQMIRHTPSGWVDLGTLDGFNGSSYNIAVESPTRIWCDENGIKAMAVDTLGMRIVENREYDMTADGVDLTSDAYVAMIGSDVIICTSAGVYRYDRDSDSIIPFESLAATLGNPGCVRRVKIMDGRLYALTDVEMLQVNPLGNLPPKRIPLPVGDRIPIHDGDLIFSLAPGYIAYPTRSGYAIYDFNTARGDKSPAFSPMARINSLTVTAGKDSVVFRGNFLGIKSSPTLSYGENSVRLDFGTRSESTQGVAYRTRLNNNEWSMPSQANTKEFTNLHEGRYLFEVMAVAPDGTETIDSIEFTVLPPWWRTWWALLIYIAIGCLTVWFFVCLEKRRVSRNEQMLVMSKDAEMARRQAEFEWESNIKDHKIVELEKEKLDKELRHKAQEMANVMINLTHKNETLHTVKRELQNIQSMLPRTMGDARHALQDLQSKITIDIKSDDVLKRIEDEFDIVHNDFIKRLPNQYPDLSNNEVLMCAYLKMNLSTKEIAPLLNLSIRGVETMRYRLRKKFALDRDTSLSAFLMSD